LGGKRDGAARGPRGTSNRRHRRHLPSLLSVSVRRRYRASARFAVEDVLDTTQNLTVRGAPKSSRVTAHAAWRSAWRSRR